MSFRFIYVHKLKQSYFVRWFSIHALNLDSNELILTIRAEFYMIISTMTLFSNWEVTMLCETFNSNYMHASWTFSFAKWIDIIESDFLKHWCGYDTSIFEKSLSKSYPVKFDKISEKDVRMYKHAYSDRYFLGRSLDFRIQDEKVRTCICDSLHTYMCNAIKQLLWNQ